MHFDMLSGFHGRGDHWVSLGKINMQQKQTLTYNDAF